MALIQRQVGFSSVLERCCVLETPRRGVRGERLQLGVVVVVSWERHDERERSDEG